MKICMLSNLFTPVVSGSSTQSESLSRELRRRGHRPFVITARVDKKTQAYDEIEGVPIYRLPAIRLPRLPISMNFPWLSYTFTPGNMRRIEKIFIKHKPDIIHLHNHMFDLSFTGILMQQRFSIPLYYNSHYDST